MKRFRGQLRFFYRQVQKGIIFGLLPQSIKACDMEMTAVVLHEGALAHYDVAIGADGQCYARLQRYNGRQENAPPQRLTLHKERRRWVADERYVADDRYRDLSDELGYAIELKAKPILEGRNRNSGHPAG